MRFRTLAATTWTILVLALVLLPSSWMPVREGGTGGRAIPHLDKLVHFGLFAGFGLLWSLARPSPRDRLRTLAAGLALAVATEWLQGLPAIARDPDALDALADAVGVLVGLGVGLRRRR